MLDEIAQAQRRMGLPETAPVVSCYEAGREGFWLHRFLQGHGITNHVVDSPSIEVNRRRRRAHSDGLDVRKLLSMLLGLDHGVGHFRPLSITQQRHWLTYHFIAMRREDLCQVF